MIVRHPRTVIIRGTSIHYESSTPPVDQGRPTLVLIHGFGATLQTWDDVLPRLEATHPILRLDLKGFGLSGRPADQRYSVEDQADLVADLVRQASPGAVVLVGHSYGGAAAILAERKLGGLVRGLVLIDAASYAQRLPFFVTCYRHALTRWAVARASAAFRSRFVLTRLFVDKTRVNEERVERYARAMRMPGSDAASARVAEQILPASFADVTRAIQAIGVPTLVIWGDSDRAVPLRFAHRLHEHIRGSRLAVLHACGHMPHEERPEEVLSILEPFLRELR